MDSDIGHLPDTIFYDSELRELSAQFDSIYKILKNIKKRAERRQSVQISESLFQYVERKRTLNAVPQDFYDFRNGDDRVCIYRFRNKYCVLCVGFDVWQAPHHKEWNSTGFLLYPSDSISEVLPYFFSCVDYYLQNILQINDLFSKYNVSF